MKKQDLPPPPCRPGPAVCCLLESKGTVATVQACHEVRGTRKAKITSFLSASGDNFQNCKVKDAGWSSSHPSLRALTSGSCFLKMQSDNPGWLHRFQIHPICSLSLGVFDSSSSCRFPKECLRTPAHPKNLISSVRFKVFFRGLMATNRKLESNYLCPPCPTPK